MIGLRTIHAALCRPSFLPSTSLRVSCPSLLLSEPARRIKLYSKKPEGDSDLLELEDLGKEPIENPPPALPITAISGFLGSGKTSLVKHILQNRGDLRIGVVVNDLSQVNVDAETIKEYLTDPQGDLLSMSSGCICCTIGGDLGDKVDEMAERREFDYLLVEGSGVALPMQMAGNLFDSSPEDGGLVRLDTLVTVVDTATFLKDVVAGTALADRYLSQAEHDDRTVGDILIEQVRREF